MLNGSILDKLTKRFETQQNARNFSQSSKNLRPSTQYDKNLQNEEDKPKFKLRRQEMIASKGQIKRQRVMDDMEESSSDSSPYIIKPKSRRFAGSFAANNKTFDNLERPKYEVKHSYKKVDQQIVKNVSKKQQAGQQFEGVGGIFDERFKRNFVFSLLEKVGDDQSEDKIKLLRREAREVGVGFFDAKIWVIGYKAVFQIEDQLKKLNIEITQEMVKQKIGQKVRAFWHKNPHEKRYYLLKLQSVIFKAFDIYEKNPGIWFDNHVANEVVQQKVKREESGLNSFDIYGTRFNQPPPDFDPIQKTKQMPYFSSRYTEDKPEDQQHLFAEKLATSLDDLDKNQIEPLNKISVIQNKNQLRQRTSKKEGSINYSANFREKVAQKLDNVFNQFINKTLMEQAGQLCMTKEGLKQLYQKYGSLSLEKKFWNQKQYEKYSQDKDKTKKNVDKNRIYEIIDE